MVSCHQLPATIVNGGGDTFENSQISNFEELVTLTLNRVILHHSSISTYMPNFIEIRETLWTDGRTDTRTFETSFIRSTPLKSQPKN